MNNISLLNRAFRLLVTFAIVFSVLSVDGPIHNLVYALFISIFTGLTAFIGWCPAVALMDRLHKHLPSHSDVVTHNKLSHR